MIVLCVYVVWVRELVFILLGSRWATAILFLWVLGAWSRRRVYVGLFLHISGNCCFVGFGCKQEVQCCACLGLSLNLGCGVCGCKGGRRVDLAEKMAATKKVDPRVAYIAKSIRAIPDFPKKGLDIVLFLLHLHPSTTLGTLPLRFNLAQLWFRCRSSKVTMCSEEWSAVCSSSQIFSSAGIIFRDVTTLLLDHKAFKDTTDIFVERYKDQKIDVIVGEKPLYTLILPWLGSYTQSLQSHHPNWTICW